MPEAAMKGRVRGGALGTLAKAVPGLREFARWADGSVVLPVMLQAAGWHFGPHYPRIGKNKCLAMLNGTFEGETVALLRRIVPKGAAAIDVGANFGYFTRRLSDLVGSEGRVFAFEAHPEVFACLKKNIAGRANVEAFNRAVADAPGTLELLSMDNPLAHSLFATGDSTGNWKVERRIRVDAVRLDEALANVDFAGRPLVMKMDIEGAEPLALGGMAGIFTRVKDVACVIEYAPGCLELGKTAPKEFLRQIAALGFQIFPIEYDKAVLANPPNGSWHVNLLCVRGSFADRPSHGLAGALGPQELS